MLKSRKQQQKGQGPQSRQKRLPRPVQHRHHRPGGAQSGRRGDSPSGNSCGEARLLPGAAAPGSEWGVPISRIFWASTFFSFLHSLLSVSWPAAPSLALGVGKAAFSFSAIHANDTRVGSSRCPCGLRDCLTFPEPVRPGPPRASVFRLAHQTPRHFVGEIARD